MNKESNSLIGALCECHVERWFRKGTDRSGLQFIDAGDALPIDTVAHKIEGAARITEVVELDGPRLIVRHLCDNDPVLHHKIRRNLGWLTHRIEYHVERFFLDSA